MIVPKYEKRKRDNGHLIELRSRPRFKVSVGKKDTVQCTRDDRTARNYQGLTAVASGILGRRIVTSVITARVPSLPMSRRVRSYLHGWTDEG
jgi:hypothetical protein